MSRCNRVVAGMLLVLALGACSPQPRPAGTPANAGLPSSSGKPESLAGEEPVTSTSSDETAASTEVTGSGPLDDREPDPSRALPAVSTRHIGMHIGGGPNDSATKAPFLQAIERREQSFLLCYRKVDEPLAGGTFGVDLYVSRSGGNPEVRRVRQRLGDENFENCMTEAFTGVEFSRPPQPTVLSYSLRFDVK